MRELKNIVIRLTAKYAGYKVGRAELLSEFEASDEPSVQLDNDGDAVSVARAEIENSPAFNLDARLRELELQYIDAAVDLCAGNISQAARILGMSRSTLYSRLDVLRPGAKKSD